MSTEGVFITATADRFSNLVISPASAAIGGPPVQGDTLLAYKKLDGSPYYPAFQQWVYEPVPGLADMYTIANKYTMSSSSDAPSDGCSQQLESTPILYLTADLNPQPYATIKLQPKITQSGQVSKRQMWRVIPKTNTGSPADSYIQNYQIQGLVIDISHYDVERPLVVFNLKPDSADNQVFFNDTVV